MEQLSIDCIAQHLKVFHEQAMEERIADFAEPCSACPHVMKECRLDWTARMDPLFAKTDIKLKLGFQEPFDTEDSLEGFLDLQSDNH